jgi:formate hydrogenlyase transcriptional activator
LQNVVERAVILSETDTFFVDESWLKLESPEPRQPREGISTLSDHEVELIEAALAECHGRISGPSGAAAKLGIPRQTRESKIRRFGINKYTERQTFQSGRLSLPTSGSCHRILFPLLRPDQFEM